MVECGWRSSNEPTKRTKVTNPGATLGKAPPMLKSERGWIWNVTMELLIENMGEKLTSLGHFVSIYSRLLQTDVETDRICFSDR